jgi:hypothetical protein
VRASLAVVPLMIALVAVAPAASAFPTPPSLVTVCTGGTIPAGSYPSMLIKGVCSMPAGNVVVRGDLTIAPGALLDDGSPGDPTTGTPVVAAVLTVQGNLLVGRGAVALLGCSPNSACSNPPGISAAHIDGSLTASNALAVVVHSSDIKGSFSMIGGGGGTMGGVETGGCFAATPPPPWSLDTGSAIAGSPVYSDVEDSTIGGDYTIANVSSCWLGSLRNQIGGSGLFQGNKMGDPDAMEIGNNLIRRNLTCTGNRPAPQFGDGASADLVGGFASGQCGFDVVLPNPAPGSVPPGGIDQHFVVSTQALQTFSGSITSTPAASLPPVTTSQGDQLRADLFNFTLAGSGLTGSGTVDPTQPPGSTGEAELSTVFPNGSSAFTAFLNCDCSFGGQTGPVTIRIYGTTSRKGFTKGTFLITSGGGPAPGVLSTLVGYGKFSGSGETLQLIEHLAIT